MSVGVVHLSILSDIGDAIRYVNGLSTKYQPSSMPTAIRGLRKVLGTKTVAENGIYTSEEDNLDGFTEVTVSVPNTYSEQDDGKVVMNGALTSQASQSIESNGTYDTTAINEIVVRVKDAGGADGLIERTISVIENSTVSKIGSYALYYTGALTSVSFQNVTDIGEQAFYMCMKLSNVSFPQATTIGQLAFANCISITALSFPNATRIGPAAFSRCYNLMSLYLTGSSICSLDKQTAFTSTPIEYSKAGQYGSIYVPSSLLASYQSALNWSYFSSRFVGI